MTIPPSRRSGHFLTLEYSQADVPDHERPQIMGLNMAKLRVAIALRGFTAETVTLNTTKALSPLLFGLTSYWTSWRERRVNKSSQLLSGRYIHRWSPLISDTSHLLLASSVCSLLFLFASGALIGSCVVASERFETVPPL